MTKRITKCRICQSSALRPFFDLGWQPFSHALYKTLPHREKHYPLALVWCKTCALVQLSHTADPEELFTHYRWLTGTSQLAQDFAVVFAKELLRRASVAERGYIFEVASNDGTFLRPFLERGWRVLGVDPARNIVRSARAAGIPSIAAFFGSAAAERVLKKHGPAQMVIARNVTPHVADPRDLVAGLARVLAPEGTLAIEIQYAKIVLEALHYDTIYHQHLCYFTLQTLERLLNEHGLYVFDLAESPISGGALVAYARKSRGAEQSIVARYRRNERALKMNTLAVWRRFARRAVAHASAFRQLLERVKENGDQIVGYGAGDRGVTLLNIAGITSRLIPVIADRNALKHGYTIGGAGIPIKSPEDVMARRPDTVVLVAWNFADEIKQYLKKEFGYRGKFIQPLPGSPRIVRA